MKTIIFIMLLVLFTMASQACESNSECYNGMICTGSAGNPGYCKMPDVRFESAPPLETYRGRSCFSNYDCGYINGRQARCIKEYGTGYCE